MRKILPQTFVNQSFIADEKVSSQIQDWNAEHPNNKINVSAVCRVAMENALKSKLIKSTLVKE